MLKEIAWNCLKEIFNKHGQFLRLCNAINIKLSVKILKVDWLKYLYLWLVYFDEYNVEVRSKTKFSAPEFMANSIENIFISVAIIGTEYDPVLFYNTHPKVAFETTS